MLQEEAVGGGDDAQDPGRDLGALVELAQLLLDRVASLELEPPERRVQVEEDVGAEDLVGVLARLEGPVEGGGEALDGGRVGALLDRCDGHARTVRTARSPRIARICHLRASPCGAFTPHGRGSDQVVLVGVGGRRRPRRHARAS